MCAGSLLFFHSVLTQQKTKPNCNPNGAVTSVWLLPRLSSRLKIMLHECVWVCVVQALPAMGHGSHWKHKEPHISRLVVIKQRWESSYIVYWFNPPMFDHGHRPHPPKLQKIQDTLLSLYATRKLCYMALWPAAINKTKKLKIVTNQGQTTVSKKQQSDGNQNKIKGGINKYMHTYKQQWL